MRFKFELPSVKTGELNFSKRFKNSLRICQTSFTEELKFYYIL